MSVLKASVCIIDAKPHFPAFSVVWQLRISSLCLKALSVFKVGLHLAWQPCCLQRGYTKHFCIAGKEGKGENMIYMMHHNGGVGTGSAITLTANLIFSVVSYGKAEEQPASCHFLFSIYIYTMHSHLCQASIDFSLLLFVCLCFLTKQKDKARAQFSSAWPWTVLVNVCVLFFYIHAFYDSVHLSSAVLRNSMHFLLCNYLTTMITYSSVTIWNIVHYLNVN